MTEVLERPMKNLSFSKIEKWLLCPLDLKYQYIDKIPQPSVWKLIAGNVVHAIVEAAYRQKIQSGSFPDWQTMDDLFLPTWDQLVAKEEARETFIGWTSDKDDPIEKLKVEYRPLVRLAREEVLPTMDPWILDGQAVIEYKVDLELQSAIGPFQLLGYIDFLTDSGLLADWKTTDNQVSARAKRTWLQFAGYSLFTYPLVGEVEQRCEKIFLIRSENGPRVERVPFLIGPRHREYFVSVAAKVWEGMCRGLFFPNTETWYCKADRCPRYSGCQGDLLRFGGH
jgi:PD-(D/E)XK nuclease superfamily